MEKQAKVLALIVSTIWNGVNDYISKDKSQPTSRISSFGICSLVGKTIILF